MTRPLEEWADLKYRASGKVAHVVPFGDQHPVCGPLAGSSEWFGTGNWSELERAKAMPLCPRCATHTDTHPIPIEEPA